MVDHNSSTRRNMEQIFRIRGISGREKKLSTRYLTLEELVNYKIERTFKIHSIDRSMMINGNKRTLLFENDLIKWVCMYYGEILIGKIQYNYMSGKFHVAKVHNPELSGKIEHSEFYHHGDSCSKQMFGWGELEVIGNTHDNPEIIPENQSFLKE
ncbi:hypothetical protein KAU43_04160 [candidate division WOR-3 bacterium]|nr:hypothetical protein [candidate division WOR-3 bacterium]